VARLYHASLVDGPGRRSVVQLQGCPIRCRGCYVPETHDPAGGVELPVVDVVAGALDTVYGKVPEHRVIALTPQGRQLTQAVVEELAGDEHVTLLSARFEGFDERVLTHLCSDAISIGPYVLSGGELPAMVLVDAVARLLPGATGSEESPRIETFSSELEGGFEYPHYTRPAEFRGWRVPEVLLSGDHARIEQWRREQSRLRSLS
jgi:tRNA (guanine37-N1)-methyltransferase